MHSPEQGTDYLQQIAKADGELVGDAQHIETGQRDDGADPGIEAALVAQQQPQYRHQNDVEPGDETGLGGSGIEQPHLLQGGGTEQHQPGQHTTDQQLAMVARDGNRLSGFEPPEQRQQGEGAEQKAQAIEGIGPHVIHPEALGDKAHTPDGGSHQQHQIGAHGDSSLNRRVTGYPIQDTRLPILLSPLFVFALALHVCIALLLSTASVTATKAW